MEIKKLSNLENEESLITQVKEIFYLCSSLKTFMSKQHKDDFFQKWCGDYLKYCPDQFYLAMDNGKVLGYLSGHLNSIEALKNFVIPGPELFMDCFESFPAHFHINCHPDGQGKGIGRSLVEFFTAVLVEKKISGVHLITSTDANNLGFYRALKFDNEFIRPLRKVELLLMGKEL